MPIDQTAQAIRAIVNIFETSRVLGNYGQVTLIPGDPGGLTYGRSQTTINSGNLTKLLERYCELSSSTIAQNIHGHMPRVKAMDVTLEKNSWFKNLLRAAADEDVMRFVQDAFFDNVYFTPAIKAATALGILTPLGIAVVYDSIVHGGWQIVRQKTVAQSGSVAQAGEKAWISHYVQVRRNWLATHPKKVLHSTVYRMDSLKALIDNGQWDLALPLVVRGQIINTQSLSAPPQGVYSEPDPGSRPLQLTSAVLRGRDVRLLQLALSDPAQRNEASLVADGAFGKASRDAVNRALLHFGRPQTGVADAELFQSLGVIA